MDDKSNKEEVHKKALLNTMGAAWFIAYCYSENINSGVIWWQNVETYDSLKNRISCYNRSLAYHHEWIEKFYNNKNSHIGRCNKLGMEEEDIRVMLERLHARGV